MVFEQRHTRGSRRWLRSLAGWLGLTLAFGLMAGPAAANHSWGSYHWARTQNPFSVKLGDNVNTTWDSYLGAVSADWSLDQAAVSWADASPPLAGDFVGPNPLNTTVGIGGTTGRKCRPSSARIEVCNAAYGNNGWLGVASIWVSGSHITQATAKHNDTYFATTRYNTPAWRQSVMCQEVGHTFGLDHQDESGADLDTCMDYSTAPNIHPDQHDYNQLARIYQHADSSTGGSLQTTQPRSSRGRGALHRISDDLYVEYLGAGERRFVWVYWKDRGQRHEPPTGVG